MWLPLPQTFSANIIIRAQQVSMGEMDLRGAFSHDATRSKWLLPLTSRKE